MRLMRARVGWVLVLGAALWLPALAAAELAIDWVEIPRPNNSCDPQWGCFGSVPYVYLISRFEVSNAQYVEFLGAVAVDEESK